MKKIFTRLAFFMLLGSSLHAQDPIFNWAASMGGTDTEQTYAMASDDWGNLYTTGFYNGTVDFDPSGTVFNLTAGNNGSIFIQKLDALGNFVWAYSIGSGGASSGTGEAITTDASGNVFITGSFGGTCDFDPGPGSFNLTSIGSGSDIFILKLDTSGSFVWVKSNGAQWNDSGYAIKTDAFGNVCITGRYFGTVDFNPDTADTFNLTAYISTYDLFIQKLDVNGNFIWAKSIGNAGADAGISITTDAANNVYVTGVYSNTMDFDPGIDTFNLISQGLWDIFIVKLNPLGDFVWVRSMGGTNYDHCRSITADAFGHIYATGKYRDVSDFDPSGLVYNLTSNGGKDMFILKLDTSGNFIWAKSVGAGAGEEGYAVITDTSGNVYITGTYQYTVDFDPGPAIYNLTSGSLVGYSDLFILKLDWNGNFVWAKSVGGLTNEFVFESIAIGASSNVCIAGHYDGTIDLDPGPATFNLTSNGGIDLFVVALQQYGVTGFVFNDFSADCVRDTNEIGLGGRRLTINPGNIVVQTNANGFWFIDSLAVNTYTITADTSGFWQRTCPVTQTFTVTTTDEITYAPSFGFVSTAPCASPDVSIYMPLLRRCFINQMVHVQVCNQNIATGVLDTAYVEVQLDSLLIVQSASLAYTALGNNTFRFDVGTLYPGMCASFSISCSLSCNAILGQTLCMEAEIYPADSCVFDTIPDNTEGGVSPCTLPWDKSSLMVEGSCVNDSIRFVVYNTGDPGAGDMDCFAAIRLYIDGQFVLLDSVLLAGGDSAIFVFSGDGRTWRFEADQHPLHPGSSHPNATVELCGNSNNWTSDLVNLLPMDDADPITDIYCGVVTGSYDPNDKTGFPLGVTDSNYISPNQELQYVIRFQNTGTDTAFTVVIRDTLTTDLDIFSVASGVASHNYSFRMYGPRVLEWTFDNILLPDSNINEPESHGFVVFKVAQNSNLSNGTLIQNAADIYFDFNAPIITNETSHLVNDGLKLPQIASQTTVTASACSMYTLNGFTYTNSGTYMQNMVSSGGLDSIVTLILTLQNNALPTTINPVACSNYTVPSGDETYTMSGTYMDTITSSVGCDSILSINLTIQGTVGTTTINPSTCISYTVPSGDETYTTSGTYMDTIPNSVGCDSILTINLTVNPLPTVSYTGLDSIYCIGDVGFTDSLIGSPSGGWFSGPGMTGDIFDPYSTGFGTFTITYSYTDGNGCTDSTAKAVVVASCGAIENNVFSGLIKIFPNPVGGTVTFEFTDRKERIISIFNSSGKAIIRLQTEDNHAKLEMSEMASGLYHYQVWSMATMEIEGKGKFIKK